jgi:diguanylate cyclase (GGDEF)-like protein
MIARDLLRGADRVSPKARLERLLAGPPIDGRADLPAVNDHGDGLAEAMALLGAVSALTVLFTAGAVIGPGFAYSDVVVLVAAQLVAAATSWRFSWQGVSERWLLALVGAQALFVASVITVTGGGSSPYLAFYAPVLALAGWHLRSAHAAIAVAVVVGTELWRTLVAGVQADVTQLAVSLPAFVLLAILARLTADRVTQAVVLNRRDQVRTAASLEAVRQLGDPQVSASAGDYAAIAGDVFGGHASIHTWGDPADGAPVHGCPEPGGRDHLQVAIRSSGATHGAIRLCRAEPFSASERRLAAILADAMGRAMEQRLMLARVRADPDRDPLTGLFGRHVLQADLGRMVEKADVTNGELAIFLLDVDDFRRYNDAQGRERGDAALQRIARALILAVRPGDRVYRYGADAFAVLAAGLEPPLAAAMGERLRSAVAEHPARFGHRMPGDLSASVGSATCHGESCSAPTLLELARHALDLDRGDGPT